MPLRTPQPVGGPARPDERPHQPLNRCESDRRSRGSDGLSTKVLLHPGRVFRYRLKPVDGAYAARRATTCPSTPTPLLTIPPKVPSPPTHGPSTAQARSSAITRTPAAFMAFSSGGTYTTLNYTPLNDPLGT